MASEIAEEGRGLVLILNKFDLVPPEKRAEFLESIRDMTRRHLPQLPGLPLIPMSASTGERNVACWAGYAQTKTSRQTYTSWSD
jgi:GTP-binding protein